MLRLALKKGVNYDKITVDKLSKKMAPNQDGDI